MHDQLGFIPEIQCWFRIENLINVNSWKKKKTRDLVNTCRESIWLNTTSIHYVFKVRKLRKEVIFVNLIKDIYKKVTIIFSGRKTRFFPHKIRVKVRKSSLTTPIQHKNRSLSNKCSMVTKRNKTHADWKGRNQAVPVLRWNVALYTKLHRIKTIPRTNEFSKFAGIRSKHTSQLYFSMLAMYIGYQNFNR